MKRTAAIFSSVASSPATTASGIPLPDSQNSLSAGCRGPLLLQDFHLIEKLQHFNRERIPERVVHAKGTGAYGTFSVTHDISRHTKARLFSAVGKKTDVFARFSTVGGERGSADTERDPRGFALKFYTEDGNWDLVGNNTPVFFIKDPVKFPDFVHTQKRDPRTNLKSPAMMWDFWSKAPESLHQVTMLFSDRGIPDGYRHMHGFGSHTFSLINSQGERVWVKWHLVSMQGIRNLSPDEAVRLAGADPDYSQRDLVSAIELGDFPKWELRVQVASDADLVVWERKTGWNPFDLTKVWPHSDFPRHPVGVLELNCNVENYHIDTEQAAFSPANVVPGMGYSPDKMLQARLFGYHDAQLHRVGTNHQHLPVNAPRCPVHNQQRDGHMAIASPGAALNYANVEAEGTNPQGHGQGESGWRLDGLTGRFDARGREDDYSQVGNLFRLLHLEERVRLCAAMAASLKQASEESRGRWLEHLYLAEKSYGDGVSAELLALECA